MRRGFKLVTSVSLSMVNGLYIKLSLKNNKLFIFNLYFFTNSINHALDLQSPLSKRSEEHTSELQSLV